MTEEDNLEQEIKNKQSASLTPEEQVEADSILADFIYLLHEVAKNNLPELLTISEEGE